MHDKRVELLMLPGDLQTLFRVQNGEKYRTTDYRIDFCELLLEICSCSIAIMLIVHIVIIIIRHWFIMMSSSAQFLDISLYYLSLCQPLQMEIAA